MRGLVPQGVALRCRIRRLRAAASESLPEPVRDALVGLNLGEPVAAVRASGSGRSTDPPLFPDALPAPTPLAAESDGPPTADLDSS